MLALSYPLRYGLTIPMTRQENIDIAKGIGIILVVIAHAFSGYARNLIFCFHMPMFFIISGMLFVPAPVFPYLQKKTIHLLLPYTVFLIFFILLAPTNKLETILDSGNYTHPYLVALYGGQHLVSYAMVFWFVTCLFLTQQIFNWVVKSLEKMQVIILAISCYLLSFADAAHLHSPWPWGLNICLASFPFFTFGHYARVSMQNGRWRLAAFLIFLVAAFTVYHLGYSVTYNMKYTYYGRPFISAVFALAGSKLVLELSNILIKW